MVDICSKNPGGTRKYIAINIIVNLLFISFFNSKNQQKTKIYTHIIKQVNS